MTNSFRNQNTIDRIQPIVGRQIDYKHATTPGLYLRVSGGGTKSYFVSYRIGDRQRRLQLGKHPHLELAAARKLAIDALSKVHKGLDPAAERLREMRSPANSLFSEFVKEYIENYARVQTRSWQETQNILERYFLPEWRRLALRNIEKGMVVSVINRIMRQGKPSSAIKAHAIIRKFFVWCLQNDYVRTSPCEHLAPPAKQKRRERVLSPNEIGALLKASKSIGYPCNHFIRLLFLTAQRRSEVAGIKRSEISDTEATWSLAVARTKSHRAHLIPLVPAAQRLLSECFQYGDHFAFPARHSDHAAMSGYSRLKKRLDQLSGVRDWCIHDIRRTVATGLAQDGANLHIISRILNHTNGSANLVTDIYNKHHYVNECREALIKWSDRIDLYENNY
jgi:integrase